MPVKLSDARLAELEAIVWADTTRGGADHYLLLDMLAEVRSSRAALTRITSAYSDPGSHPEYHERVKGFTRRDWPTLTSAIEAAIR